MLKQTARSINTSLEQFCADPMGASQIHGYFLGLIAGPDEIEENAWLTELFYRDAEAAKSRPSFESFPHLKDYVDMCERAYSEAYEELSGGEPAKGHRFEERTDEEAVATAREFSAGFLRGFRLAGGMDDESRLDDAGVRAFSVLYALANPERTAEILEGAEESEELSDKSLLDLVPAAVLKLAFVMHGEGATDAAGSNGNGTDHSGDGDGDGTGGGPSSPRGSEPYND